MKRILFYLCIASSLYCPAIFAQTIHTWGDQGDGTFINPILPSDYSDPDAIRVGNTFYMVASDFHFMGMQILSSRDLVNWKVVTQLYNRFDYPGWNENAHYAGGSWAPSIRYHNGKFYVYFCTPDEGLFMTTAEKAEGPWAPLTLVKMITKWEDPCPFWDNDGKAYLGHSVHGAGPIILHRMSDDGRKITDKGDTIYKGPVAEGTKFYHLNGWYYLCIPEGGVGHGWQTCLRAHDIHGPYERKIVLEQGSTDVNGPHQGALINTPNGEWWFLHFQELSPLGRIVHLEPVTWKDGWPVIGKDLDGNDIGEPVSRFKKPAMAQATSRDSIQVSDDFSSDKLSPIWQWNHNPKDGAWSLKENPGSLTLHAVKAQSFKLARNTLTQKLIGFKTRIETTMDVSKMEDGQRSGLAVMGKVNHIIGIMQTNGERFIYEEVGDTLLWKHHFSGNKITFYLDANVKINEFSFSIHDKKNATPRLAFAMKNGFWKGARYALFCYNTLVDKGKAIFNDFRWQEFPVIQYLQNP